ncbi:MAG TPA: ABC transporter ATP-binding protein [Anaerolineaceae bacterium]
MDAVITMENLRHQFGEHVAVDDISVNVGRGEVFGLLGPNGAGKTTTVRLLNGLYQPAAGQMRVLGFDPVTQGHEVRRRCGVLTETPALYERLTALQNLRFFADLSDMPALEARERIAELLAFFELDGRANDRVSTFSKGMKQRLALARALLTQPELIFLDEPTAGLDPEASLQVNELIAGMRERSHHTVFLCTHNLYEAGRLCDRLGVMNAGRLVAAGTLSELRALVAPGLWVDARLLRPFSPVLDGLPGLLRLEMNDNQLHAQVTGEDVIPLLNAELVRQGAQVVSLTPRQVSLEEIYFALQGETREKDENSATSRGAGAAQ